MSKLVVFLKKYSFFIGIILFLIILAKSNPGEIFHNIKKIDPLYLILAAFLSLPMLINKSLCWNYLKRQQGIKYSLKNSFLMYGAGMYIGIVTPGRLGEIAKALYLKKDGYSLGKSLVSVVLDRISDFAFLLIFLCFGSLFLLSIFQKQILIILAGVFAAVGLFLLLLKTGFIKQVLNKVFNMFVAQKYQKSWKINFQDFINDLKIYKLKDYLIVFLITAFSWVFYYLQMYVLAKGVNINVPFFYLAITVTITGFITLIPISISGIGTRDVALILLFAPFLILKEQVIVFSALILLMSLFMALIGLVCWFIKPIGSKTKNRLNISLGQKQFWEDKKRAKRRPPYHPVVRAFVLPKVRFIIKNIKFSKNTTLLDAGCGNGFFTYHFAKICDTTGIDFSEQMLKINPHNKLVHGNVKNLPFPDNSFDVVFCSDLLHHLTKPEKAIKEMQRVAKKYVIISEPNRNNPLMFLFGLLGKGERRSLKFTKEYLNKICQKLNLVPITSFASGLVYPNRTPNIKTLLSILKKFDFNQPLGSYVTIIYKKQ